METLIKGLIGLSALSFLLAVVASLFTGDIIGLPPESFSRACSNLALVSIALGLGTRSWRSCSEAPLRYSGAIP